MFWVVHLWVCACVRACVQKFVSTISYKPVDWILQNWGYWCIWGQRWTDQILKIMGSKSGHSKVICFSEFLRQVEACTSKLFKVSSSFALWQYLLFSAFCINWYSDDCRTVMVCEVTVLYCCYKSYLLLCCEFHTSLFYRRPVPFMGQPDYRIHELNRRLQQRTEVSTKDLCSCIPRRWYLLFVNFEFILKKEI